MYNETQLQAIKTFWKKDLEIWCKIFFKDSKQPFTFTWEIWVFVWNPDFEILWHEPHLEDLFRVAEECIEKNFSKFCYIGCTMSTIEIYGWRKPDWKLDEFWPANNTYTLLNQIGYKPSLPLLDQPNLSEIVNLFSK